MKTTSAIVLVAVLAVSSTADAYRRRHFVNSSDYQSNGVFGLGLELGDPTGITGKVFTSPSTAIDFGIGDLYHTYYIGDSGLHLYADYLWHPALLASIEPFKLPFYVGVGLRTWFFDYGCGGPNNCGADVFGIRVPVGIDFDFNNVPLDAFIQIVPTFDFFRGYAPHDFYIDFDFSVGIRYWFI
jgi:hypothetical protein